MTVSDITDGFPPTVEKEVGPESTFYGAADNVALKLGLPRPRAVASHWMHGWHATLRPDPAFYFWSEHHAEMPLFVWTREQETHIGKVTGKSEIEAVGAPYLYASNEYADSIERVPGSLLIMPPHNKFEDEDGIATESYRDEILDLKANFEHVAACIHYLFYDGSWGGFFKDLKIPYFSLGTLSDINFHNKQRCVFRRFESMTTTTFGSHVPYAGIDGCKVSVFGEGKRYTENELKNAAPYKGRPDLVRWALDEQDQILAGDVHGHLFCHPTEAKPCLDWARNELGFFNMVDPGVLVRTMGFRWGQDDLTSEQRARVIEEFGQEALLPDGARKRFRATKRAKRKLKRWKRRVVNLKNRVLG